MLARSPQLVAAARLLAASWALTLQFWIFFDGAMRSVAYGGLDFALAVVFYRMSRRRWFPVPLFFLHGALVVYHAYAIWFDVRYFWIAMFLNRAFEIALFYVIGCAAYRLHARRRR